jgi:hypothetical protein
MADILKTVLLLALPASGKSEVRRYLDHLTPEQRRDDFHMGPTVQLDDFPYVHIMRRIDDERVRRGEARIFFDAPDRSFKDPRDWGTLIELLNEDHDDLVHRRAHAPKSASIDLFDRLDRAAKKVGIDARLSVLDGAERGALADALEQEASAQLRSKTGSYPDTLEGKTLVIEFARGGKSGAPMPLAPPFGYGYALSLLAPAILESAAILYVWVTPEESRRKNEARSDPDDPGSILHHGVPSFVMLNDYGTDDIDWLERSSSVPGRVCVDAPGRTFRIPIARFDNRVDKTSFIRDEPDTWASDHVRAVHGGLKSALSRLAQSL